MKTSFKITRSEYVKYVQKILKCTVANLLTRAKIVDNKQNCVYNFFRFSLLNIAILDVDYLFMGEVVFIYI